jgi:hypothetical protein
METAMQQHIEWLKATLDLCKENAPTLVNCISLCISDAESRLEMEKNQIIDFGDFIIDELAPMAQNRDWVEERYNYFISEEDESK